MIPTYTYYFSVLIKGIESKVFRYWYDTATDEKEAIKRLTPYILKSKKVQNEFNGFEKKDIKLKLVKVRKSREFQRELKEQEKKEYRAMRKPELEKELFDSLNEKQKGLITEWSKLDDEGREWSEKRAMRSLSELFNSFLRSK